MTCIRYLLRTGYHDLCRWFYMLQLKSQVCCDIGLENTDFTLSANQLACRISLFISCYCRSDFCESIYHHHHHALTIWAPSCAISSRLLQNNFQMFHQYATAAPLMYLAPCARACISEAIRQHRVNCCGVFTYRFRRLNTVNASTRNKTHVSLPFKTNLVAL